MGIEMSSAARPSMTPGVALSLVESQRLRAAAQSAGTPAWAQQYRSRLAATDAVAVVLCVAVAYAVRFVPGGSVQLSGMPRADYVTIAVVLAAGWLLALSSERSRDARIVGIGQAEYVRVFSASWRLFATVAVAAYLFELDVARGFLAVAFPLGTLALLLERYAWRQWLRRQRDEGYFQSSLIVIGNQHRVEHLVRELNSKRRAGYRAVGACVIGGPGRVGEFVEGVPVLGDVDEAAEVARSVGADAVAVTGSDAISLEAVRHLGWDLEPSGAELIIAPALTDIAGPRILLSPVSGLPLVHVEAPRFSGGKYAAKTAFDWIGALILTLAVAPVLVATAVLVKLSSPGPVFYRQTRIGLNGEPFQMLKFRSMYRDADKRLEEVMGGAVGMFYKRKDDPRITPVGKYLRRYSIDELPQLLNVLKGDMSLVGPRPQIDREVALYDRHAFRRLLVKPGLTGLWQVSGRSSLTPEESIRLDVFYVENWTLFGDLSIMLKTAKAVFSSDGAY